MLNIVETVITFALPLIMLPLDALMASVALDNVTLTLLTATTMQEMVVRLIHQAMWITVMAVTNHVLILQMEPLHVKIASV